VEAKASTYLTKPNRIFFTCCTKPAEDSGLPYSQASVPLNNQQAVPEFTALLR